MNVNLNKSLWGFFFSYNTMLTVQCCFILYLKEKNNSFIFSHSQPTHCMDGIDGEYNYEISRFMILFSVHPTNLEKHNQNLWNFGACYFDTRYYQVVKSYQRKWEYYIPSKWVLTKVSRMPFFPISYKNLLKKSLKYVPLSSKAPDFHHNLHTVKSQFHSHIQSTNLSFKHKTPLTTQMWFQEHCFHME